MPELSLSLALFVIVLTIRDSDYLAKSFESITTSLSSQTTPESCTVERTVIVLGGQRDTPLIRATLTADSSPCRITDQNTFES
ncbi:hypothetical protein LOK49_LG12G01732 [Camellia lanceoleosa]|uniref:Uncharacterized protein n=1 Tax=Camellia lanceoleosa TaxID=1840588 RepID=A0ACC0FU25_9ERIC|nr:hypothetical protein LOK49_LG12G01732 [Camellia lanceoleosa]